MFCTIATLVLKLSLTTENASEDCRSFNVECLWYEPHCHTYTIRLSLELPSTDTQTEPDNDNWYTLSLTTTL
jgi:hypothetical protein